MLADAAEPKRLLLPRLGAAIVGAAFFCRAVRLPLALGCLVALGNLALSREGAASVVPETPPDLRPRRRTRRTGQFETGSTEDSFPASDPPSWTPITGPGTRH